MSTAKNSGTPEYVPRMDIDSSLDTSTQDGLVAIDALIHEDPALAEKVVSLYSSGTEVADQWLGLISEGEAKRYPFRLTAALGQTASREALRFVGYDDETEGKIAQDQTIKDLITRTRNGPTAEARQEAALKVAFTRLSRYAGALALTKTHEEEAVPHTETAESAIA